MRRNSLIGYLLLLPVGSLLIGIFFMGIVSSIAQSLGYFPEIGKTTITLDYYQEVLKDPYFVKSFIYTLGFSSISAILSVIIGIALSYFLLKSRQGVQLAERLARIPVYVPHIVGAALIYMVFTQTGVIARCAYQVGAIEDPAQFCHLVQDPYGIGIVLVYLWKGVPFVMMTTFSILKNIDTTFSVAAQNLGANSRQVFWHIQLPIVMPTVISNWIILFAFALGGFEVPYLIGATSPRALPVLAYLKHTSSDINQRITAMVINVIIIIITAILLGIYVKLSNKIKKYR